MRWTLTVSHSIEFICHALQLTLDQAKTILSLADVDIEVTPENMCNNVSGSVC
jgi:acetamidase/formamidase